MEKKRRKNLWTGLAMLVLLPLLMFWVFRGHYQEIWDNIRAVRAGELLLLLGLGLACQLLEAAAGLTLIRSQLPDFSFWQAVEVTFLGCLPMLPPSPPGLFPCRAGISAAAA